MNTCSTFEHHRPNPRVEEAVHGYGMLLLLGLILLVTVGDIQRLL